MTSTSIYTSVLSAPQLKTCTKCNIEKDINHFPKNISSKDGRKSRCKSCVNKDTKQYDQKNRETRKEYNKKYGKQYQQDNAGICNAKTAKRKAAKLNATPKWIELDLINQMYIDCKLISEMTGILHHVDHIVPLQSDIVCGLHCFDNLRIISATENTSKGNRYWPDMPA